MTKKLLPLALVAALSACTLAPTYQRPGAPVAGQWPSGPAYGNAQPTAGKAVADIGWRDFLTDPQLQKLVEVALANNRDLRVAMLNVEATRAQYGIQRAALFPTINAQGSGSRQRVPADLNSTGSSMVTQQYSAGLGFTAFELDLFGRVRSLKDAALEEYFSSQAAQRSAQITLVSEVASQYLTLKALDEQLALAQDTLKAQQSSYDLTNARFQAGAASELDVASAATQVETARSNAAALSQQRAQAENALAVLVGGPLPADLPAGRTLDAQGLVTDLPAGLPSDLLERRPDIAAAEHQLKSANANIGAARAAFFPDITLTGSYGSASSELGHLFKAGQTAWSFAPQITLPIFDFGKNSNNLDLANARQKIAVAQYEKTVQTAFREVADALTARAMLNEQVDAQQRLVAASQQRYQLAELRYRSGVDSYLSLLDAQRSLYAAQQGLIQTRLARLSNLVTLYKALGGGWQERS
jgi:multidrug efflux system outer membrane protein